jgi:hypothetical protein
MPLVQRAVADLLGPMLPLGGTQPTASMNIFWRWSPHLHSGKPCKTPVARTKPCSPPLHDDEIRQHCVREQLIKLIVAPGLVGAAYLIWLS